MVDRPQAGLPRPKSIKFQGQGSTRANQTRIAIFILGIGNLLDYAGIQRVGILGILCGKVCIRYNHNLFAGRDISSCHCQLISTHFVWNPPDFRNKIDLRTLIVCTINSSFYDSDIVKAYR
jgi:hypothetical protein